MIGTRSEGMSKRSVATGAPLAHEVALMHRADARSAINANFS
jgi:hypothetical protein